MPNYQLLGFKLGDHVTIPSPTLLDPILVKTRASKTIRLLKT